MLIKIFKDLSVKEVLKDENIFVMDNRRAITQDIRPLQIAILNLMPTKEKTEEQLLRLLSNTPLQLNITFLTMESKNTSRKHLEPFYKFFSEVKDKKFDGLIIGVPVEKLDYEEVRYWEELSEIMKWSKTNVYSTFHICDI